MRLSESQARFLAKAVVPFVIRWAERRESEILVRGLPLDAEMERFAGSLGLAGLGEVRVLAIDPLPLPVPRWMYRLGRSLGLPVFAPAGMALGNGIYVLPGHRDSLPHELVHVLQYRRLGGIRNFMMAYLTECFLHGYAEAPLEREARELSRR